MNWGYTLATLNAVLNAAAAIFLYQGRRAILANDPLRHRNKMICALVASGLFLISYLTRFYLTGVHRYEGHGWLKTIYLFILATHTPLAASVPFFAGFLIYYAAKKRFQTHRKVARIAWPIWMYVSITGVLIYVMLYHLSMTSI